MAEISPALAIPFVMLFGLVAVAALIVLLWVLPITLGLRCARRKNYSPLWMLFGINPIGGWVAFIVLSSLPGRRQCPRCGGFIAVHWKLCPYCQTQIASPEMPIPLPPGMPPRPGM